MKFRYIAAAILFSVSLASCRKYVEIKTQGQLVPGDINNYRLILNNSNAFEVGPQIGDLSSDDVEIVNGSTQQSNQSSDFYRYWRAAYTWQTDIYPLGTYQTDNNWNAMYNSIAYANTVIGEVPTSTGGSEKDKAALIGEALVHRADAYLMLMNTYAKPYNASTAGSDLGVPMVLVQTTQQSLVRPSSQTVYDQIIKDLKQAIPSLAPRQTFNTQPSKVSAYGELARCYLYMNNYAAANTYADSALAIANTLNDLGAITVVNTTTYPIRRSDPEILLSKVAYNGISAFTTTAMRLSSDLLALLGTKDQRYTLFTSDPSVISTQYVAAGGRFFTRDRSIGEARNIGPNVPEMMLIKAEYYARTNDVANAMLWVNRLRQKRFKPADYTPLTATTQAEALSQVIDERHREFFCRMLRWWDQRRLKQDPAFQKTYTRTYANVTYTLEPTSDRYVFRIPPYQIQLNPEIQQNP
ncbi:RagB/SusD family nutrient uptake outer membrane protein [Mucilaginibacter auburnensis]|uniref:SusD-like starch-binding protein associating with outer membrane n=1 Tax=Mucilaginibacter auburnensis TaxID=1457233 RepID=A0A2H9VW75_9SPHI|nr:RagB/SusD family nutrient uptake outer membrane protein [Mucilaginibacter auburnensis]PJJ85077.1 SusD-like starch-binding protein associating with outer membrane [Mucilaginibacter auburnensis]